MQLPVDPAKYSAYLAITAVMVAAPGPANLFAIATGAWRGRRAVVAAAVGMNLASLVWYAAAGLGLAALALARPELFRILAWAGAGYLIWLALRAIVGAFRDAEPEHAAAAGPARSALRDGFMVQIANPKALLFTTAILPPFIDAARPIAPQMALFAAAGVAGDMLAMTAYGFGGAAIARRMRQPAFRRAFNASTAVLLLGAAALILLRG